MRLDQVESVAPLALLTMKETGAAGYVLYAYENGGSLPVRLTGSGLNVPADEQQGIAVASFSLRVDNREVGSIAFAFREATIPERAWGPLEGLARTLESLWSLFVTPDRVVGLATRIGELQAELADLKIADRARGYLAHPERDASQVMSQHVESVLRAHRVETLLEDAARDLEDQINERRLVSQAKDLLQTTHGLSEEEAHAQLRLSSRRSRQRLGEVALQLIKETRDSLNMADSRPRVSPASITPEQFPINH